MRVVKKIVLLWIHKYKSCNGRGGGGKQKILLNYFLYVRTIMLPLLSADDPNPNEFN